MSKATVKADCPVISIGNIAVGGSGKTPMTAFLASALMNEGIGVGIVSSGYGRQSEASIIEAGYQMQERDAAQIGDELKLLANLLPQAQFAVAQSKAEAVCELDRNEAIDVILVDDGFQHYKLHRDFEIVTYDAGVDSRLLKMFPYGLLREPTTALNRADLIVITRSKFARDISRLHESLQALAPQAEIYRAQFLSERIIGPNQVWPIKYLDDKSVFLFAGVGNFSALKRQVSAYCADLDDSWELSDHQQYDLGLLGRIRDRAEKLNSDLILTTGKDWMKLGDFDFGREIYYLDQTLDLDPGEEKLIDYLIKRLRLKAGVE